MVAFRWNPVFDALAEFAASLERERAMWQGFIQRNGITGEQGGRGRCCRKAKAR